MHAKAAIALAIAVSFACIADGQETLTASEVRIVLTRQGYTNINDLKFKEGAWSAAALTADGHQVELSIDPQTGQVYPDEPVAQLSEEDARAALSAAGYTNIHDLEFKDGFWKAEANDAAGKEVEVKVDPADGQVIGAEEN